MYAGKAASYFKSYRDIKRIVVILPNATHFSCSRLNVLKMSFVSS